MFQEDVLAVSKAALMKIKFFKSNPVGYFIASMLAGIFVGFGVILIFTAGGHLTGLPYGKIIMGVSFGIALSLVIIAGSELFTGNNMIMTVGILTNEVKFGDVIKLWLACFLGNWVGAILLAFIFYGTGLGTGPVGEFIASTAATKMSIPMVPLFLRGILCNILVCLATWCSFRCKSESGKLIMIFWCLFAFITSGFEHSIANMTLLTIGLFSPLEATISVGGYFYNIITVTLGNMVGGILFVAIPYFMIAIKKEV